MEQHEREIAGATCDCCQWTSDDDDCSLYNEIIMDTAVLEPTYLLANIEAVMFPTDRPRWVEQFACEIHQTLRRNGGVEVPLLRYNALVAPSASEQPAFQIVSECNEARPTC